MAGTAHCGAERREDRTVGVVELRPVDLAVEHEDLVSESEDLGIAGVTGGEHPSEARENQFREEGQRVHGSATVSGRCPKLTESQGVRVYGTRTQIRSAVKAASSVTRAGGY